jgi:hypothetical protein
VSTAGEPGRRVRGSRLVLYVLGGTLLLGVIGLIIWKKTFTHPGSVQWNCYPEDDRTATCEFKIADGGKAGSLCFTMVLDCKGGMHSARVCSGPVKVGDLVTVRVPKFDPPMPADATCQPPRYLAREATRD